MKIEIFEFPPESEALKNKKTHSKNELTAQQTDSNKSNHKKRNTEKIKSEKNSKQSSG